MMIEESMREKIREIDGGTGQDETGRDGTVLYRSLWYHPG
jgi:hypothetical protein